MILGAAAGQSDDRAARVRIPERRRKPRKGRDQIDTGCILYTHRVAFAVRSVLEEPHFIPQPLNDRSADKDAALQSILGFAVLSDRNRRQQAVLGRYAVAARIHQQEAARTVSIFHRARRKAALSEERALLVSDKRPDRDLSAEYLFTAVAVDVTGVLDLRQHLPRDPEIPQDLLIPFQCMDVEKHRPGCVRCVGREYLAAGQIPQQPGVDCAKKQFALFRSLAGSGHMVQNPFQLGRGEIRIRDQAGFLRQFLIESILIDLLDAVRGAAALPDDRVIDRLACIFFPHDGGLALIRDTDRRDLIDPDAGLRHRFRRDRQLRCPDIVRIMLHIAGLRENLSVFLLRYTYHLCVMIKQDTSGTRRTLIQSHYILCHDNRPLSHDHLHYIIVYVNPQRTPANLKGHRRT